MSEVIITVSNLSKHYDPGSSSGIQDISFSIRRGDITAIIGESGSGKSTLLKCIYGLLKPDSGEIYYLSKRVKGPDEQLIPGHPEMRMVSQDFSLNVYAKVYDNIAAMLANTDVASKHSRTMELMERLHISHLKDKKVITLSGGEQQRVAIARAFISGARVLLLDEPFSQVDTLLKNQLRTDLKHLAKDAGMTIILVSHDPTDGLSLADELIILKDGRLLQQGFPRQVYEQPGSSYVAAMLGNAVLLAPESAEKIGIPATKKEIVFYPEWVTLTEKGLYFTVKDIYFKGYADELLLEHHGVMIRAYAGEGKSYRKGEKVGVEISRYCTFQRKKAPF